MQVLLLLLVSHRRTAGGQQSPLLLVLLLVEVEGHSMTAGDQQHVNPLLVLMPVLTWVLLLALVLLLLLLVHQSRAGGYQSNLLPHSSRQGMSMSVSGQQLQRMPSRPP